MSDLNRVTLVGRLTRDPEVRYTGGGMPIVNLGLAVNTRKKDGASDQSAGTPVLPQNTSRSSWRA